MRLKSLTIALLLTGGILAAQDSSPFLMAIVRRDAVVVPFASYDGKRWRHTWPPPSLKPEVPLSLRDVPQSWWGKNGVAEQWTFWSGAGESRPVQAKTPTWVQSQCQMTIGLKSDHAPAGLVPAPVVQPHPKDGLATTGTQRIEPIEIRTEASPEWSEFVSFLQGVVPPLEQKAIDFYSSWSHPVVRSIRKQTPFGLEALYRAPAGTPGRYSYFFEGMKRYAMPATGEGPACDLVTFVSGWVLREANGVKSPFNLRASVTYCNLSNVEMMLPLGLLELNDQRLWVVQWSGWGHERYSLIDVLPGRTKIVLETAGGGC